MQVSVIKNSEPKNKSILLTAAAGGGTGLLLRHFVPVWKSEMDYVMFNQSDAIKEEAVKTVKDSVLDKAKKQLAKQPKNEALDLFIKRAQAKDAKESIAVKEEVQKASKTVRKQVKILIDDIAVKMRAAKNLTDANIKNAVKQKRSISAFLLPGIALGALGAYVYNVIGTISEE